MSKHTIIQQAYLTDTTGGSNKHYLVALVADEVAWRYYLHTGWGPIGSCVRTNAKLLERNASWPTEEDAVEIFQKRVAQQIRKGYLRCHQPAKSLLETFPDWWHFAARPTKIKPKPKPESEHSTLMRKDAPWAF